MVRHGRTAWNATGRFQGHTDVPLDEEGRSQARGVARLLEAERFDVAVSSDLVRARETAEIVLGGGPPPVESDPRWREMRFGAWEGLVWNEIVERQPELAARPSTTPRFYTPPGG
ncbi:MAG: histidine phosphatase family protein, partial [Candidatus Eremiobacteraeota bacterium]|nr:histidine phosphatase family protein [Candidatus Eremiobacteraeota bacterium]